MNADELRLRIAELLRDELEMKVRIEGKRIRVEDEEDITVILVTPATREALRRELLGRDR